MSESRLSSLKLISWNRTHYSQTSLIRTPKSEVSVWATGLLKSPCIAHQPDRLDGIYHVQIHLIGIPNSPDHYSVRNKEVTFT